MDPDSASQYHHLLAIPTREQLYRVLTYVLDEDEFLSPYGIRSLSKFHLQNPFTLSLAGRDFCVKYVPAESDTYMFGGNSNWRGPIWVCSKFTSADPVGYSGYEQPSPQISNILSIPCKSS